MLSIVTLLITLVTKSHDPLTIVIVIPVAALATVTTAASVLSS